jgi:EmrB/QacA subfamily drug resistance transporter
MHAGPDAFTDTGHRPLIFLVAAALFMENLDGTIITTALPAMARSFSRPPLSLNIGVSAYLLALGIFIPASGWVAERFGTRRVFAAAIALFTVASALCGLADSLPAFVATRIAQGMAGAMMVPVGRLVILKQTPRDRLMAAMSTLVWPSLIGPVLGPPLGGFITTHLNWRWIFYLNVPLGLAALAAALRLVPDLRSDRPRPFDWPGFLLCGTGTVALLVGLEQLAATIDAAGIGLAGCGVLLLFAAVRHFRRTDAPMLELSSVRIPTFRAALRGGTFARMAIGSAPFLLPLMFQVGFGYSAELSGLLMLGVFGANLALKAIANPVIRRAGFRRVLIWNGLFAAASLAACALLRPDTPVALVMLVLVAGGLTRSMQFSAINMIAFADVPQERMSGANGLSNTVGQLSMGAGVTLGAMAVRLGQLLAADTGFDAPGAAYRLAFLLVAGVALLSLFDVWTLPRNAGDQFAARTGARRGATPPPGRSA